LVCRGCFDFEVGLVTCLDFAPKSKEEEAKWRNILNEEKDGEEEKRVPAGRTPFKLDPHYGKRGVVATPIISLMDGCSSTTPRLLTSLRLLERDKGMSSADTFRRLFIPVLLAVMTTTMAYLLIDLPAPQTIPVIPSVYEFSQLVCVARQVGDYRVQVLIEPTEPKAGERFWVTAVISELDGRPASVIAYIVVTDGLRAVNFTRPVRVANGIFRSELLLERPGRYVASIAVSGSNGTYLINVPITVLESFQSLLNSVVVVASVMGAFWGVAVVLSLLLIRGRKVATPQPS
jgi:hypothetical protein